MATTPVTVGRIRGRGWHWWRPRDLDWWVGAVLVPGALCFLLAPIQPIAEAVGLRTDLWAFFVGSVFFTSSGILQLTGAIREQQPSHRRADLWSAGIQLAGMLFFNVSTYAATLTDRSTVDELRLVWSPDLLGSVCFLVSAVIGSLAVGAIHWPPHTRNRWTATVNLFGCIFFMVSAVAAYILPSGEVLRVTTANRFTTFGAACFLICAVRAMADADLDVGITPKRIEKERAREQWVQERLEDRPVSGPPPA
jgi:hypothetical protein